MNASSEAAVGQATSFDLSGPEGALLVLIIGAQCLSQCSPHWISQSDVCRRMNAAIRSIAVAASGVGPARAGNECMAPGTEKKLTSLPESRRIWTRRVESLYKTSRSPASMCRGGRLFRSPYRADAQG